MIAKAVLWWISVAIVGCVIIVGLLPLFQVVIIRASVADAMKKMDSGNHLPALVQLSRFRPWTKFYPKLLLN